MADTKAQLKEAFELIKQERLEEAQNMVRPITDAEPDNADAWWLLANAVSDERQARLALINVLKINPGHTRARDLLDKLNELYPPRDDELMMMLEIEDVEPDFPIAVDTADTAGSFGFEDVDADTAIEGFAVESSIADGELDALFSTAESEFDSPAGSEVERVPTEPVLDEDGLPDVGENPFASLLAEDEQAEGAIFAGLDSGDEDTGRKKWLRPVLVGLLLVVVLCAVLFLVMGLPGGGEDTGDSEVDVTDPGMLAIVDAKAVNSSQVDMLEQFQSTTEVAFRSGVGADAEVVFAQGADGYLLIGRVCAEPGPQIRDIVLNGFRLLAVRMGSTADIQDILTGAGISVEICAPDAADGSGHDTLYRAIAPLDAVKAFSENGDMAVFQESWQVDG